MLPQPQAEQVRRVQSDLLVRLGFPAALGVSEAEYREAVPPLPPRPPGTHAERFPLPVLVEPRLTLRECLQRSRVAEFLSKTGGDSLLEASEAAPFGAGPYWIWCNSGGPYQGKSVAEVKDRLPAGERWLTATECIFLAVQQRDRLRNQPLFCAGSLFARAGEPQTAVVLEPSAVGVTIDWTSVTNAHPHYGCVSCVWPPDFAWDGVPEGAAREPDPAVTEPRRPDRSGESADAEDDSTADASESAAAGRTLAVADVETPQPTVHRVEMTCARNTKMEVQGSKLVTTRTTTTFAADLVCPSWQGEAETRVSCPACSAVATIHITERGTWNGARQWTLVTGLILGLGGTVAFAVMWFGSGWPRHWGGWRSWSWGNPLFAAWRLCLAAFLGLEGVASLVAAWRQDLLDVEFGPGQSIFGDKPVHTFKRHEGPHGSGAQPVGLFQSLWASALGLAACAGVVAVALLIFGVGSPGQSSSAAAPPAAPPAAEVPAAEAVTAPGPGAPVVPAPAVASPQTPAPAAASPAAEPAASEASGNAAGSVSPAVRPVAAVPVAAPAPAAVVSASRPVGQAAPGAGRAVGMPPLGTPPLSPAGNAPAATASVRPGAAVPPGFRIWRDQRGQSAVAKLVDVEATAPVQSSGGGVTKYTRLDSKAFRAQYATALRNRSGVYTWRDASGGSVRARPADISVGVVLEDLKGQVRRFRLQELSAEDQTWILGP